jgi:hypothetical protein
MKRWMIEKCLGLSPPFLERSLYKQKTMGYEQMNRYNECGICYITSIVPKSCDIVLSKRSVTMIVRGYQKRNDTRINSIEIFSELIPCNSSYEIANLMKTRILNSTCFDETVLHVSLVGDIKVEHLYTKFSICKALRGEKVNLYNIDFPEEGRFYVIKDDPVYEVKIKTINLKNRNDPGSLHYKWVSSVNGGTNSSYELFFESRSFLMPGFQCMFCFKEYTSLDRLELHIKCIHLNCKSEVINGKMHLVFIENDEEYDMEFQHLRKDRKKHTVVKGKIKDCYFEPEIMGEVGIKKKCNEWLTYLSDKRLDEIIDIPTNKIKLMKEWNAFILKEKVYPGPDTIISYVRKFVFSKETSVEVFDFLTVLYTKCVISQEDVMRIMKLRTKKKNGL